MMWLLRSLFLVVSFLVWSSSSSSSSYSDSQRQAQSTRIIGGVETGRLRYPYMASLTEFHRHRCGGTLVAPDIIITAAHCSESFGEVQLGRHNKRDPSETYESLVVEQIITSPHYYRNKLQDVDPYDIAVVKVYGQSNATLAKINRDGRLLQKDQDLRVVGWGVTGLVNGKAVYSSVLRETNVQYIPNEDCRQVVGFYNGYEKRYEEEVIDVTLCAANFEDMTDSCQGDSGGPLLVLGEDTDDDLLVGITSAGFGCADPILPAFYARVSKAYDWIDEMVCLLSLDPPADFNCNRNSSEEFEYAGDCLEVPSASQSDLPMNAGCTKNESNVTLRLELVLDGNPEERGWIIQSKDSRGMLVTFAERPIFSYADIAPQSNVTEKFQLPNNRQYVFTILDAFGDGSLPYIDPSFSLLESSDEYSLLISDPKIPSFGFLQSYELTIGTPPTVVPTVETPPPSSDDSRPYLTIVIKFGDDPQNTGFFLEIINNDDTRELIQTVYPGTFVELQGRREVAERVFLLPPGRENQKYRFTMTDNEGHGLHQFGRYEAWLGPRHTGKWLFRGDRFFFEAVHIFEVEASFLPGSTPMEPERPSGQNSQRPFCAWCLYAFVLSTILPLLF